MKALTGFGHVFSPKALNNILFSQDCPWSSSYKQWEEHIIQGQGKRWGAVNCLGFNNLVCLLFPHHHARVIYFDGDTMETILTKWSNENHQSWDKFASCFSWYNEWRVTTTKSEALRDLYISTFLVIIFYLRSIHNKSKLPVTLFIIPTSKFIFFPKGNCY